MIKFIKYWWNKFWLFITKFLRKTNFDNLWFANFVDNKLAPQIKKEVAKYQKHKDYNLYKSRVLTALDIIRDFIKLTKAQEERLTKILTTANQTPATVALLISKELKAIYNTYF